MTAWFRGRGSRRRNQPAVGLSVHRVEQSVAIRSALARARMAKDDVERDHCLAAAWRIGADAQQLHDATGLSGEELKKILIAQGEDPSKRRRGWRAR